VAIALNDIEKRRADRWNFLFIAGMWFKTVPCDCCTGVPHIYVLWGEILLAHNTGIGWRNIIENMQNATVASGTRENDRHEISSR
jgi:hypothetical protein